MKRSWILALWLGCLCIRAVNAQTPQPKQSEITKGLVRLLTRAERYEPFFNAAARRYGLDPRLLWVVAFLETRFNPTAVSPKGARGMLQFMPATAARYGLLDPHETVSAIDAAARYLRDLLQRYGQRADLALAAYNAGEGAVDAALQKPHGNGIPPYRETQNYVRRGLQLLQRGTATPVLAASRASLPVVSSAAPSVPKQDEAEVNSEEAVPRGVVRQSLFMQRQTADAATPVKSLSRQSRYFGTRIDKSSYVPPN